MTDAITIHDKDFNIIKSNKSAEKLLDLPFLKTNSTKCYKYYHGSNMPMEECPSCYCAKTGESATFELYEPHLKKQIEIRAMPRFDSNGNINGTIHLVRDITERKDMEERLKIMSITDELTGLYNRRGFFTLLKQQLKIIKRQNDKAYMLYIDIDNFKTINDNLGHSIGDSVLIDAVNILKSTYRESDIIARIGGDEFVVFTAGNNESNLNKVTNRLQANIDIYNAAEKRGYTLSMSVGLSVYDPKNPTSTDDLLAKADRLMYKNKRQKRMG
jgi:diguanylate cyclase (GGDEF)-like protein